MDLSEYVFPFNEVDDEELICIFSDVQHNIPNNDSNFDTVLTGNSTDENSTFDDIDPDDIFF